FTSLDDRTRMEDAFYGSRGWLQGPREALGRYRNLLDRRAARGLRDSRRPATFEPSGKRWAHKSRSCYAASDSIRRLTGLRCLNVARTQRRLHWPVGVVMRIIRAFEAQSVIPSSGRVEASIPSSRFRLLRALNADGVQPNARRNASVKWLWLEKPRSRAKLVRSPASGN